MTAPGRIVIAAYACCGPGEGTYAVTSTDGGATWGQPILAGTVQTDRGTGGPGPYSMTVQESTTNGVKTQVLSATGPQTTEVAVLDPNYWYPGGTAMVDSLVPAAAMTDLINTQVRVFNPSTGTSYGDPANWRPPQILPGEDEPSMASTAAAAYVMTHAELNGDALQDTYRVRKVNSDGTLGAPVQASDVGNVIFGRLAASPSGGLSTFWSTGGGTEADIMSSFSADGVTFQPARMLVENADSYDLAPAITSDGSGFVAWDDNAGSVWMTGIPAAVDANACRRELTVRTGVVARVSAGCWTKSGSSYKTKADVSINGIEFVTGSGPDTVTIDMRTHKLTAGKGVVQKAGFIVFAKDSGTWDLDKLTTFDHLTGSLFDFGMGGHATVSFAAGKATLKINVKLPDPFDPVTGVATLFTTLDGGLQANEVRVEAKHATVGPITIDNLLMFYDSAQSTFGVNAPLGLPGGGSMSVGIGFDHGVLVALFAAYREGPPFPGTKASGRRSIQALGERGPVPLPAPPATFDPDDDSDVDDLDATDLDGHDAGVAHGSGAVRLPAAPPGAAHAQPLAEALRALVQPEDEEPLEPAGPDDERSEETQPHRVPGWRERRAAASTPPASQRPLIDSLRQRDDEVAPAVENPPKGDLN